MASDKTDCKTASTIIKGFQKIWDQMLDTQKTKKDIEEIAQNLRFGDTEVNLAIAEGVQKICYAKLYWTRALTKKRKSRIFIDMTLEYIFKIGLSQFKDRIQDNVNQRSQLVLLKQKFGFLDFCMDILKVETMTYLLHLGDELKFSIMTEIAL